MQMVSWTKAPDELTANLPYDLFMRTTPVNHGVVIRPFDNYIGETELESRRYSIVRQSKLNGTFRCIIASSSYDHGWDSENLLEPFEQYINGHFVELLAAGALDTVNMTSVDGWDGTSVSLINCLFS